MGQQDRTSLKGYFQTGDIPTEGQYIHLIDSKANMVETNSGSLFITNAFSGSKLVTSGQIKTGGNLHLTASGGHITASGNISSSGTGTNYFGGSVEISNVTDPHLILHDTSNAYDFKITNTTALTTFDFSDHVSQDLKFSSDTKNVHMYLDGGTGKVGINAQPPSDNSTLYIYGDLKVGDLSSNAIPGSITASKSISASLDVIARTGSYAYITSSGDISGKKGTFTGGIVGVLDTPGQTNITSLGTLSSLTVSGDINANGNIVGDDGTSITNLDSVECDFLKADADATTFLALGSNSLNYTVGGENVLLQSNKSIQITKPITASGDISGSATSNIIVGGTITAEQITSTDDITATGTVQAEHLSSTDDIVASDDITAGGVVSTNDLKIGDGRYIGSTSDIDAIQIAATGKVTFSQDIISTGITSSGAIFGTNMGTISNDFIPVLPTDFAVSSTGLSSVITNNVLRGGEALPQNSSTLYFASYVIPSGKRATSFTGFGSSIKIAAYRSDITTNSTTLLFSNGSAAGVTTSFTAFDGDGLKYITIQLTYSSDTDTFHGGKINFA